MGDEVEEKTSGVSVGGVDLVRRVEVLGRVSVLDSCGVIAVVVDEGNGWRR